MTDDLELLVDRYGVAAVVVALAEVCRAKAEHVRTCWQDRPTACQWERDARRLDRAAWGLSER